MNACDLWQLQPLNKQLLAGYKTFSTSLKNSVSSPTRDKLSCPFFIHLGPNYHTFEKKCLLLAKKLPDGYGTNILLARVSIVFWIIPKASLVVSV